MSHNFQIEVDELNIVRYGKTPDFDKPNSMTIAVIREPATRKWIFQGTHEGTIEDFAVIDFLMSLARS